MSSSYPRRTAIVNRNTKETKVQLSLSLDGGPLDLLEDTPEFDYSDLKQDLPYQDENHHASQITAYQHIWIWTGVGFLDHMLHALAKHAGWSLRLRCKGDLLSTHGLDCHQTLAAKALRIGHLIPS
jgi:imidazoleglycerol-phosphate dehydratase